MKVLVTVLFQVLCAVALASEGHAKAVKELKSIRATEISSSVWTQLKSGELSSLVVEFHQGDRIPVNIAAVGDLLETSQSAAVVVTIKRNFWLMLQGNDVEMSFDGSSFQPIKQLLTGSLSADASASTSGGAADVINVIFAAYLK